MHPNICSKLVPLLIVIVLCFVILRLANKQQSDHILELNVHANSGNGQLHELYTSDDVLLYRNGYTELKNKKFLEYLRNNIIVNPSKQKINLTQPELHDFSQLNQSR